MGFLKKLFGGRTSSLTNASCPITVTCDRCGETIEGRINLANDLSQDYESGEGYYVRKVLMGSGRCFQQIEVELRFDAARKLLEKQVSGGKFVEES